MSINQKESPDRYQKPLRKKKKKNESEKEKEQ